MNAGTVLLWCMAHGFTSREADVVWEFLASRPPAAYPSAVEADLQWAVQEMRKAAWDRLMNPPAGGSL